MIFFKKKIQPNIDSLIWFSKVEHWCDYNWLSRKTFYNWKKKWLIKEIYYPIYKNWEILRWKKVHVGFENELEKGLN